MVAFYISALVLSFCRKYAVVGCSGPEKNAVYGNAIGCALRNWTFQYENFAKSVCFFPSFFKKIVLSSTKKGSTR